jgi:hypothetical protein
MDRPAFISSLRDLICSWVDLSADDQGNQIQTFHSAAEIHQFFNRSQPSVQVLIDAPLTLKAHAALAKLYARLASYVEVADTPPSLAVDQRKTQLTFQVSEDSSLFTMAYFATLPFTAGRTLQRHLMMMTSMLQTYDISRLPVPHQQHLNHLNDVMVSLCHRFPHQPAIDHARFGKAAALFFKPVQVKLTNSRGQTLNLYHSPTFGVRHLMDVEVDFPMPTEEELTPGPTLEVLIDFLVGMQTATLPIEAPSIIRSIPTVGA